MLCRNRILISCVALLLPSVLLCAAEPGDVKPDDSNESQPARRGLTLDIGQFIPSARGIVVQIGQEAEGGRHVDVDVDLGAPAGAFDDPVEAHKPAEARHRENYVGVFTRTLPAELAAQLGGVVGGNEGLLVLEVLPDSPAAKAGLKKHDILLHYDDHKLATVDKLKELIAADKPGRTVKFAIVREATPQTLEVVLAQREMPRPRHENSTQTDKSKRMVEVFLKEKREPIIISKKLIQVPGVTIQLGTDGHEEPEAQRPRIVDGRRLLITTEDGKRFKVAVKYVAADGAIIERSFEGTPAELDEKMKDLPDEIRSDIRRTLEGFDADNAQSRTFRFKVEPRVEEDRRVLRISMRRPGAAGETRILEIEQRFDGHESIEVADLMKIDVVASELKDLGPAVREKVEATLNRVQIPEVRVGVEKSQ